MLASILHVSFAGAAPLLQSIGLRAASAPLVTMQARAEDMQDVAELHAACFRRAWSVNEIARLADRSGGTVWLAREEGRGRERPLGFLILSQAADEAEIVSVGVDPRARGRGVGGALVREAIRTAHADRAAALFLEVDETNEAALALYRRLRFREVGERAGYYARDGAPASRALVMRLDLR